MWQHRDEFSMEIQIFTLLSLFETLSWQGMLRVHYMCDGKPWWAIMPCMCVICIPHSSLTLLTLYFTLFEKCEILYQRRIRVINTKYRSMCTVLWPFHTVCGASSARCEMDMEKCISLLAIGSSSNSESSMAIIEYVVLCMPVSSCYATIMT